ncbi:MAG: Arabinogalactan endo-beta-1,4-galactanase [Candidatus Celerinatantimonas neptuna]|nr:MAG: Arabinogalactan endo-beta-1,4-galactanase [Candidatus Celerinatantimonas neptuna]
MRKIRGLVRYGIAASLLLTTLSANAFVKGADVSWVSAMESAGYSFYNSSGHQQDLFQILKSYGINAIRLRVWVDPSYYNGIQDVIRKAKRAKAAGMKIMIDFHYSDTWADPAHQKTPSKWSKYSFNGLMKAMWWYTHDSLVQLKKAGISPAWVQIGNETNNGMLWPDGKASKNMKNFAWLINTGYSATKKVFPGAKVIVHLANCQNNKAFRWIFDGLHRYSAKYDIIGASIYPTTVSSNWKKVESQCYNNLNDMVSRYHKSVMITEIGAPWDNKNAKSIVSTMINYTRHVKNGKGLGVFYWEPESSNYKNYTMGAWNPNSGRPMATMNAFR